MEKPLDDNTAIQYWMYEIVMKAPDHLPFRLIDILPQLEFNNYESKQYKRLLPDLEREMLKHFYLLETDAKGTFTLPPYIKNYEDLIMNGYPLTDYSKKHNSVTNNYNAQGHIIQDSSLKNSPINMSVNPTPHIKENQSQSSNIFSKTLLFISNNKLISGIITGVFLLLFAAYAKAKGWI